MSVGMKCTRCGETVYGYDECDAENAFSEHICKDMPLISDLDDDLLDAIIENTMEEEQAFVEQKRRNLETE